MIININSKKLIDGEKPVFDFQGPTEITLKTDQDFASLSTSLYLAGSRVYNDSSKILFLSNTYTINEDEITFIVDTYTENYLTYISEYKTPFNLEFGAVADNKTIFLLDKAFANPRVYIGGIPPTPVDQYYTKSQTDSIFLSILSANHLYYTKEESDERYLGGEISGYLKLDDPQPISGDLVINGSTSTSSLIVNGTLFDPSNYVDISVLANYLPLSGGNVDFLSISGIPVDPRGGGGDISGYMHLSGDIIEDEFSLSAYGGTQHSLRTIFKLTEEGTISIGAYANANESVNGTLAIGTSTAAQEQYSTALGYNATSRAQYATALGWTALNSNNSNYSLALGAGAKTYGNYSVALGPYSEATYDYQIAIGETDTDVSYLPSAAIIFSYHGDNGGYMDNNLNWHFLQNVEVKGDLSVNSLSISGASFDPSNYVDISVLANYLPLSGGNVEYLSINNVDVIPSSYAKIDDLSGYLPLSGGTLSGDLYIPSAYVSGLIQNGVNYDLSGFLSKIENFSLPSSGQAYLTQINVENQNAISIYAGAGGYRYYTNIGSMYGFADIKGIAINLSYSGYLGLNGHHENTPGGFVIQDLSGKISAPYIEATSGLIENNVNYNLANLQPYMLYTKFDSNSFTPESNHFYSSQSAKTQLNLTITSGLTNCCIFFTTGNTFSFTATLDEGMYINEPFDIGPNGAYLIAIEKECVLWTQMEEK